MYAPRSLAEAAAAQVSALRAELSARAELAGAGEREQVGACALQQAALASLDGREEVVVRLRLTPGSLATGGLGLVVVVHDPDEDMAQDVEEAEPLVPPAVAPDTLPPPSSCPPHTTKSSARDII